MKIKKLWLRSFRNIQDTSFEPGSFLNFIVGPNAQGKTSVLEAMGWLSTLRSFRGSKPFDVIQQGQTHARIGCDVVYTDAEQKNWDTQLEMRFEVKDTPKKLASKVALINGKTYRSSAEYLLKRFHTAHLGFHCIVFNPSDHELIRGEPRLRRMFLNHVLAAEQASYLKALQAYQRVLEQRNGLLRSLRSFSDRSLLQTYTEQLIDRASILLESRLQWLSRLQKILPLILDRIAPDQHSLEVGYSCSALQSIEGLVKNNNNLSVIHFSGQKTVPSLEEIKRALTLKADSVAGVELEAQTTLFGPHRDDWLLNLQGESLKRRGSQGEVRSALLALKLAEVKLFQEVSAVQPLFLLDDFSSELDQRRRAFLLEFLKASELQVFVTSTEEEFFLGVGERFWMSQGQLKDQNASGYGV